MNRRTFIKTVPALARIFHRGRQTPLQAELRI